MSQAVVHGNTVYLAGQVADDASQPVKGQTEQILKKIDALLKASGTDKSKLLSANIWLSDVRTFADMNAVWDAWVSPATRPRAPRWKPSSPGRNSWSRLPSSPRAIDPVMAAADSVTIRDGANALVITLDDLKKYHGQDFFNGLAMALKIMQIATATLGGGQPFNRRKLRLVLGLSPPACSTGSNTSRARSPIAA